MDPDNITLDGWIRREAALKSIEEMNGWVSPRLGIRFEITKEDLIIYKPDGARFLTYVELFDVSEQERKRADVESARAERLAARLRELGENPDKL